MHDEFEVLRKAIAGGNRYLVIAGKQVFLATDSFTFAMGSKPDFSELIVLNLEGHLATFDRLAGEREEFSVTELAAMAGTCPATLARWEREGIVEPATQRPSGRGIERSFSRFEAFLALTYRALRMRNVSLEALAGVGRFLRGADVGVGA